MPVQNIEITVQTVFETVYEIKINKTSVNKTLTKLENTAENLLSQPTAVGSVGGEWAVIHRCKRCGKLSSNRVAADDNPMKLMSVALKPLCEPPFPIERIEELTALMGGDGSIK